MMHLTDTDRQVAAHHAWLTAQNTADSMGRKMDKIEKQAMKAQGIEYVKLCSDIELTRIQYVALEQYANECFDRYQTALKI